MCAINAACRGSALSGARRHRARFERALIGPRRQHRHARCGCATVPSPEQSGGSRWVVSTEKLRWWQVRAAASAAPEPRRWRREGAAVACTDIDGAAAEIIATRIRATGGRPTGIARAERGRPFSSPRGGTTAVFSGSRVLAVAVNRLWRKFNDNLLGRF
jgi:hypothetical protein